MKWKKIGLHRFTIKDKYDFETDLYLEEKIQFVNHDSFEGTIAMSADLDREDVQTLITILQEWLKQ